MKKLLFALGLVALTSTGCTLYFGEDDDSNGGCPEGTYPSYDDYGMTCIDDGGGYYCNNDYQCAAGCWCGADGTCVESGYCSSDAECPEGTHCDPARQSCTGNGGACTSDADCPFGSYCDEASGVCVGSWTCENDAQCGTGYVCQDGTCVPIPCDSNDDCAAGCYCDTSTGSCIESCYCTDDATAESAGWGWCDEDRTTCMPGEDPTPACEEILNEAECLLRDDCGAVYRGLNCTDPNGIPCTEGGAECTCESFVFDECVTSP
jgi:hypothetical protein